jgi:hypothetical protein
MSKREESLFKQWNRYVQAFVLETWTTKQSSSILIGVSNAQGPLENDSSS